MIYKVTTSNLTREDPVLHGEKLHVRGFIAEIEPPIDFNPEVVSRVMTLGCLDPNLVKSRRKETPFDEAVLIGSTDEKTVIYARLGESVIEGSREFRDRHDLLVNRTHQLLGLLGVVGFVHDRAMPPSSSAV